MVNKNPNISKTEEVENIDVEIGGNGDEEVQEHTNGAHDNGAGTGAETAK